MRHLRLDGSLVAELQAALPALPVDREELRGLVSAWVRECVSANGLGKLLPPEAVSQPRCPSTHGLCACIHSIAASGVSNTESRL